MKNLITIFLVSSLAVGCEPKPMSDQQIIADNFAFAGSQLALAAEQTDLLTSQTPVDSKGRTYISPRTINEDGTLRLVTIRDWTSGFYPGSLWYAYEHNRDTATLALARRFTEALSEGQWRTDTHDVGFLMYCSYGNGYRLTGDTTYRNVLIQSARSLATRFNPTVGCLRSWDHNGDKWNFPVIIDNMMNLELLFWAARETGDTTLRNIATSHADVTMKNHFRPDFSSFHVVSYNPATGEVEAKNTHQGYADASSWARGQAWGVYGYTMCYRESGDERYLAQAQKIAEYIFSHPSMPADLIPYWDYNDPTIPNAPRDASAAMVTASALYELSTYAAADSARYKELADNIVRNATQSYRAKAGQSYGFLLLHSTGNKPKNDEIDAPINYADYYFLEALTRKHNLETNGKL